MLRRHGLQILINVAALLPLAILIWDFTQGQLTANPIQEIQLRTGKSALVLLILSLACTPVSIVFGLEQVIPLRRTLGLYAFMYASLHLLNLVGLDYRFDFALLQEDIGQKRYIIAGLVAYLSLLPLAITSTKGWIRRLGKNWERLHRLVYFTALVALIHFTWQVKADIRQPLLYSALVVLLLLVRTPPIKKAIKELRNKSKRKPEIST